MSGQVARGKRNKVRRPVDNFQSMLLPNGKSSLKERKTKYFQHLRPCTPQIFYHIQMTTARTYIYGREVRRHSTVCVISMCG